MDVPHILPAAAFALAGVGAAQADGPRPIEARPAEARPLQAQPVEFGAVSGVAYYAVERDGLRVVATPAQADARDEPGTPLRVEAVLAPGGSVVLSTPREAGAAPDAVTIVRQDDRVLVRRAVVTNERAAERGAARNAGTSASLAVTGRGGARRRPPAGMARAANTRGVGASVPAPEPGKDSRAVRRNTA